MLLLVLDTLLAERRGRRARKLSAAEPAAVAAALVFLLAGCARQSGSVAAARAYHDKQYAQAATMYRRLINDGDRTVATLYNYGTSLVSADSLTTAAEALERAAETRDAELRYRGLFNLGLAHLKRGLAGPPQQADESLDAALAAYKKVLLLRSEDLDAKWNYELALRKKKSGGGGGGGGANESNPTPSPESQAPKPSGGLGERQAEQLLGSAAREERDVQAKRQRQSRVEPPPGGKDW
jgi:Ca-activated chloride channel family protein